MQNNSFAIGVAVIFAIVLVVVGAYAFSNRSPVVAAVPGYTYPGYTVTPASYMSGISGPPYYIEYRSGPRIITPAPQPTPPPSPAPTEPVMCTMDAKMCPDGSYVGRVPPTCQFAACPGA